jgi:two-component system sensor histidine kinase QseC
LKPLIGAMNGLFSRIETMLKRERRFTAGRGPRTADSAGGAAAQWDVVRRSQNDEERATAEAKLTAGMERMGRLVAQMLALSRLEASQTVPRTADVRWRPVVEQVVDDCLELADRRRVELVVEWPPASRHPMPLLGEESLIVMLLRNLVDNAVRYARTGSTVNVQIAEDELAVENLAEAPPSPEQTGTTRRTLLSARGPARKRKRTRHLNRAAYRRAPQPATRHRAERGRFRRSRVASLCRHQSKVKAQQSRCRAGYLP